MRSIGAFGLIIALVLGCGEDSPPTPEDVDCSSCGSDLCWYDYDIDADEFVGHCAPWPQQCLADQSCACLNTETDLDGNLFCTGVGGAQNTDACELVNGRPLIYCETNLG